jgi:glycosyltransferase involved in cell wall biosynthesis
MKILAVYPYLPYPLNRGAYYRGFYLLQALAKEHDVDLLALAERGEGTEFRAVFQEFCRSVDVISFEHPEWESLFPKRLLNPLPSTIAHWQIPALAGKIQRLLSSNRYDALHIYDIVLAQYFLTDRTPMVVDRTRVDLQYQLMERARMNFSFKARLLNLENLAKLWRFEKKIAARCAVQVVCGPDDETFVRSHISQRVPIAVIPNGVDLKYFNYSPAETVRDEVPTVLFCGAMDYNPNVDALRWYFGELHDQLRAKIPALKVLVVGKDPVPEVKAYASRPGVVVTGGVPDVRPYYRRAWLQIVPLRIGGGTRLKIVESIGIGTPVISTTIGAQGLDLAHQKEILLADTAEDFVREAARALGDEKLRAQLTVNGLSAVRSRLSWEKLGNDLCAVYREHFGAPASNASHVPKAELQLA